MNVFLTLLATMSFAKPAPFFKVEHQFTVAREGLVRETLTFADGKNKNGNVSSLMVKDSKGTTLRLLPKGFASLQILALKDILAESTERPINGCQNLVRLKSQDAAFYKVASNVANLNLPHCLTHSQFRKFNQWVANLKSGGGVPL